MPIAAGTTFVFEHSVEINRVLRTLILRKFPALNPNEVVNLTEDATVALCALEETGKVDGVDLG